MKAFLPEKGIELGNDIRLASNILARMKGLLGKSCLAPGQGLLIRPCNGIHTFFMKFSIDAVFLDRNYRVVAISRNLPPYRLTSVFRKAFCVLELPAGTVNPGITVGDSIEFS
ncbi:MAG: DUF192 domain-containing protein [Geobacteraceae bacterium]